jgi:hypothetical protein
LGEAQEEAVKQRKDIHDKQQYQRRQNKEPLDRLIADLAAAGRAGAPAMRGTVNLSLGCGHSALPFLNLCCLGFE